MLLRKGNEWIAVGIKEELEFDNHGHGYTAYYTVSREINPHRWGVPTIHGESYESKASAVVMAKELVKNLVLIGYSPAEPSLFLEAFEAGVNPFVGFESLPGEDIEGALKVHNMRSALKTKRKIAEDAAAVAKAEADKQEADNRRQKAVDEAVKRAEDFTPKTSSMEEALYKQARQGIEAQRRRRAGYPPDPIPAPPVVDVDGIPFQDMNPPKKPKVETPDAAREAGVDYDEIAKKFRNLELD